MFADCPEPMVVGRDLRKKQRARLLVFFKVILGGNVLILVTHLEQTICPVLILIHRVWPEVTFHCFQTSTILSKVGDHTSGIRKDVS